MSKNLKVEQGEQTTRELIEIARQIFSEKGYADTSTTEIVKQAGVTRGALYHHFDGKEGLFRAVFESIQEGIGLAIMTAVEQSDNEWEQLIHGCQTFIAECANPQIQRIVLIDAPSVLGRETWRQVDEATTTRLLAEQLQAMHEAGKIKVRSPQAMAHLLAGAMNEAVLWVVEAEDSEQALKDAQAEIEVLIEGLRT